MKLEDKPMTNATLNHCMRISMEGLPITEFDFEDSACCPIRTPPNIYKYYKYKKHYQTQKALPLKKHYPIKKALPY